MYFVNKVVLDWRTIAFHHYILHSMDHIKTEQNMFWCDRNGLYVVRSEGFEMTNTNTLHSFIVTQYYIATDGPHNLYEVCQSTHIQVCLPYCSQVISWNSSLTAD
jgi:hypothetical protein